MAATRSILHVLETYQNSRLAFVQSVSELAIKPQYAEILCNAQVVEFLKPLLVDTIPQVQQLASLALARLASSSEELAAAIVMQGIHIQAINSLKELDRYSKKPAAHVLDAIAKHTPELARAVADAGAVQQLALCLEEFDPAVREIGASALGNIASHSPDLASIVVDSCAIPLLVLCVQESDLQLRRSSVWALGEVAKHGPDLAQSVADAGTLPLVLPLIATTHIDDDARSKRHACNLLSSIAKHSANLAQMVVAIGVFPGIFMVLKDGDPQVRRASSIVIREVCKHTVELARVVMSGGGGAAIVENIAETRGSERLPGIMSIGHIGALDAELAATAIDLNGFPPLLDAIDNEEEDHIKSASAWSIGQISKHGPSHALAAARAGALPKLLSALLHPSSSADLRGKCRRALGALLPHLAHLEPLDSLLQGPAMPEDILELVIRQLSKILVEEPDARTRFVASGGFEKLQKLHHLDAGTESRKLVDRINSAYPIEIVHYYSPEYSQVLLQSIPGSEAQLSAEPQLATPPSPHSNCTSASR